MTQTSLLGPLRVHGRGTRGTDGRLPKIALRGAPRVGSLSLRLAVHGVAGHTPVLLLIGRSCAEVQTQGVGVLVDLSQPFLEFFTNTDPYGEAEVTVTVPDEPGLVGNWLAAQWFVRDAGASQLGFAASPALEFEILA